MLKPSNIPIHQVEACSVLVLSLDATAATALSGASAGNAGGGAASEAAHAETTRMAARLEVLETAWAHREVESCIPRFFETCLDPRAL